MVNLIERSADRAVVVIEDLLDVARMQSGRLTVDVQPTDTEALLTEALELHRSLAEEKGLLLELECTELLPQSMADHDRVLQVLSNLLGNAIKFTPHGGRIVLGAAVDAGGVVVSVKDSGPGILPEYVTKLFDAFWQARRGTRAGAGLGLAIAKGIVEAHGGRIWCESDGKHGSTFCFTVPMARSDEWQPGAFSH